MQLPFFLSFKNLKDVSHVTLGTTSLNILLFITMFQAMRVPVIMKTTQ